MDGSLRPVAEELQKAPRNRGLDHALPGVRDAPQLDPALAHDRLPGVVSQRASLVPEAVLVPVDARVFLVNLKRKFWKNLKMN